ncbi:uncharacterized protein PAE49_005246 [Odontesthes bonariensis]|uniref:uncharacterized protein LOC142380526 n=1 Tax=Odontesthes bonariensis TaxID=219752 RepID=UPI003F58A6FB
MAFRSGDRQEQRRVQRELKETLRTCRDNYRRKLESKLEQNCVRDVWTGMKHITGMKGKDTQTSGSLDRANQFNQFFNRFSSPPATPLSPPSPHTSTLSQGLVTTGQVKRQLDRLHQGKAAGPDGITPWILRTCASQLSPVLVHLYNLSLSQERVPLLWKTSHVVPVPKKSRPSDPEDYRPVALTSHVMKVMERLVLAQLRPQNHLRLNVSKTREMVMDFRRKKKTPSQPLKIKGEVVEEVEDYKYLGVVIDNRLDWASNTDAVCKKGMSRLYFLRKLRSFNVCSRMLETFYHSVVAGAIFFAAVCWGSSIRASDSNRLDKIIRKAGSVLGQKLESLETVVERRTRKKLLSIMDNKQHPLHHTVDRQRSTFSHRLLQLRCRRDRYRKSFLPHAITLYNNS